MTSGFIAATIAFLTVVAGALAWLLRKLGQRDEQWKRAVDDMEARDKRDKTARDVRRDTDEDLVDRLSPPE